MNSDYEINRINIIRLQECLRKEIIRQKSKSSSLFIQDTIALLKDTDKNILSLKESISTADFNQIQGAQSELWRLTNDMKNSLSNSQSPSPSEKTQIKTIENKIKPIKQVVEMTPHQDVTSASTITNLLMKQKDISAKELEDERIAQRDIVTELTELTALLKENTLAMSQSVQQQNMQLDLMQKHAQENFDELAEQKKKLTKQQKSQTVGFWATVWILVTIFLTFAGTYAIIRLFPKP